MPLRENPEQLHTVLTKNGLSATLVQSIEAAFERLQLSISTFLLLDLDLEEAIPFIKKVVSTFYDPPPYIIAADRYPCSMAHTEVLNLGTDICLEKPLDTEEVLAVINAVLRRTERLAHPKPLDPAPPVDRGELTIDPMRRSVSIGGRLVELTANGGIPGPAGRRPGGGAAGQLSRHCVQQGPNL